MVAELFHPIVSRWFADRFRVPTDAQRLGWPAISAGYHTLIAAPTGSGKTLAAFLVCIDRLLRQWVAGELKNGIQVVYVSPLKALSNDIEKNLRGPLAEISAMAVAAGIAAPPLRVAVRTGDTPASERQSMLRKPPHILVTTPESLYLLLTSARPREQLTSVHTVIVDEIHAVARDKRGSHLTLTLERLAELADCRPSRVGLSATQRPLDQIARFLVGSDSGRVTTITPSSNPDTPSSGIPFSGAETQESGSNDIVVIDSGHARQLDLAVEVPPSELEAVCSNDHWAEIYESMTTNIRAHRSTLIFVNTRRLAERVTLRLSEILGEEAVASHHGSLSRELRLNAERRLRAGELKALVATASLEMGIDIGYIDLVCQVGSPRSIATLLQRVGRAGHHLDAVPKGRLFPLTRDELVECLALVRAVGRGNLDAVEIPIAPLDILAQQIVAAVACEEWDEAALFEFVRRAWPYRDLDRKRYREILQLLSNGVVAGSRRGAYLHHDQINGRLRARRNARLTAITAGGAIPESAEYRVLAEPNQTFVGTLDEDFAIESMAGDIFVLGNTSWRIVQVRASEVAVRDAEGAPPTIPFWFGEAPGRTIELSKEISQLRQQISDDLSADGGTEQQAVARLRDECHVAEWGAQQAVRYIAAQREALGVVPTCENIVFERFFDESGGMQLVIHAPFGSRVNRAWGLALRKRFCRSFDFELQAAATDNGILLSIGPQHSFPIESLFKMLGPHNAQELLEQAALAAPMFQVRWRWNVTRALAVLRSQAGKRVPPPLQRFRSDDLLAAAFPETVGCLENHHGDVVIPDHPLVQQTMHDCLHEAMDTTRWLELLDNIQTAKVQLLARDTREPSPFSYELLTANPYAFLDDAPLEERRARAVQARRGLSTTETRDLGKLDAAAIDQVRREAWPVVRDAEELHDALRLLGIVSAESHPEWDPWFQELLSAGRATTVRLSDGRARRAAAERWPVIRAVYGDAKADPVPQLTTELEGQHEPGPALLELVRGLIHCLGPTTAAQLSVDMALPQREIEATLESLEGEGVVLRGSFTNHQTPTSTSVSNRQTEWCDRRLLARIHRLTVDGLRRQIRPVSAQDFLSFLTARHRLGGAARWTGQDGLREALSYLQAFEVPFGVWETLLGQRVAGYDPQWLDYLFLSGELSWGRLRPPPTNESGAAPRVSLCRSTPVSLLRREDLPCLVSTNDIDCDAGTTAAIDLHQMLKSRGALFFSELAAQSSLLPTQVEEALRELTALGLVTSDTFAAARYLARVGGHRRKRTARRSAPPGRWSCFPGDAAGTEDRVRQLERWCQLLLTRYGVVFRDLLTRESAAPSWGDLVQVFRRMELRGELRGGRFVAGVGGEQFAREADVDRVRSHRDKSSAEDWLLISAADPLNLAGIIGGGRRVAATHRNLVVIRDGCWIGARTSGSVELFEGVAEAAALNQLDKLEIESALRSGRPRDVQPTPHFPRQRPPRDAQRPSGRGSQNPVMRPR